MSASEIDAAVAGFLGELGNRETLSKTPPALTPTKDESADLRSELVSAVTATIEEILRRRGLL